jgi:hypothetical protein
MFKVGLKGGDSPYLSPAKFYKIMSLMQTFRGFWSIASCSVFLQTKEKALKLFTNCISYPPLNAGLQYSKICILKTGDKSTILTTISEQIAE